MRTSGQLLPVAIPRLGFHRADPIGHFLDKHRDEFAKLGIAGQRGVDKVGVHSWA